MVKQLIAKLNIKVVDLDMMDSDNVLMEEKHQDLEQHVVIEEGNVVSDESMKNLSNMSFKTYL